MVNCLSGCKISTSTLVRFIQKENALKVLESYLIHCYHIHTHFLTDNVAIVDLENRRRLACVRTTTAVPAETKVNFTATARGPHVTHQRFEKILWACTKTSCSNLLLTGT